MSERPNADLIAKVRKILERTEGKGCTPAEAEQAFTRASRLMAEHNLTMADVKVLGDEERWDESPVYQTGKWTLENNLAYGIVKEFFFVEGFFNRSPNDPGDKILFLFGKAENVEVATFTFRALLSAFTRLWDTYRIIQGRPASEKRLFIAGVAKGFRMKLEDERETMTIERDILSGKTGGTTLALANIAEQTLAKYQATHPGYKGGKGHYAGVKGDQSTLQAGIEAGRKLNLNRAIGESAARAKGLPGN